MRQEMLWREWLDTQPLGYRWLLRRLWPCGPFTEKQWQALVKGGS